jgi:hypothetical protein
MWILSSVLSALIDQYRRSVSLSAVSTHNKICLKPMRILVLGSERSADRLKPNDATSASRSSISFMFRLPAFVHGLPDAPVAWNEVALA